MPEGQGPAGNVHSEATPEGQGRLVGRRYRLLSPVGRGGMGMVWHAHDVLLDRDVAVKELILPYGLDQSATQVANRRVLREARSAARLSHPGIVTVHDVVEEDGRPWIVMELVRAWSLEQAVRQSGPLPVIQAAEIGIRVLDAIRHAHAAGILHRDVKPGNVLLTADRVVLTDFGIAAIEGDVTITQTGLLMGSPAYIPPERLQGRPITHAADLWSFGATLYAAVEGRPPYEGADAVAVLGAVLTQEPNRPQRAGALLPVIEGLLRKNPADRIAAAQVAEMLERVLHSSGAGLPGRGVSSLSMPTPQNPTPAGLLPPFDLPSGPLPSRIIETPSGPVRVPFAPEDLPGSMTGPQPGGATGPHAMPAYDPLASPSGSSHAPERSREVMWPTPSPGDLPGDLAARPGRNGTGEHRTGEHRTTGPIPRVSSTGAHSTGGHSTGGHSVTGPQGAGRRRRDEDEPREERDSRSMVLIAVTAVAVIGLVVTLLFVLLPSGSDDSTPEVAQGVPSVSGQKDPSAQAGGQAPKGFTEHSEDGVSVAVPKEWTVTDQGGSVTYSGPKDSAQRIKIQKIKDGSLAALQAAEQNLNVKDYPDYTQVQLGKVTYRYPAADWEYTYTNTSQVTVHAVTRYVEAEGQGYSITFSSPDYDWGESAAPVRQALWNTFTPA
ncbi:serine/threonine-protein kinase [Planotetraspora silvatica]|nr:serine/threonine-protein kinase [Planotetraspora silvatica]